MARKPSFRILFSLCAALLVLSGCREQAQIRHYLAPKESLSEPLAGRRNAGPPFRYVKPEGWEARPPEIRKGFRIPVVLRVAGDGGEAEVTAMSLAGEGGGVLENVNRWRRQLGLDRIEEAELSRIRRSLKVGQGEAAYVDIVGPEGEKRQRTLGAVLRHGGATWFFTLKGPADLVGKQHSNFEAFVSSVRFDDEPGAAHE